MKDIEMRISTCGYVAQEVYTSEKTTWSDFCKRISKTNRTHETVTEYANFKKDQQDKIKDVGGYVLGDLENGHRSKNTVRNRCAIALDLDFAPRDFWNQFTLLFSNACAVYSTHKHRPNQPKYRLIIPLDRTVSPDEYEAIARWIASDAMEINWTDDTTFQPSRMMFWPSTSKDGVFEYHVQEGEILSADKILSYYDGHWDDISRWAYSDRVATKRRQAPAKKQEDPTTKKGPVGNFCRTYTIQEAVEKFIPDVYLPTRNDDRWTYAAGSTSGGLVIYDGGTLAYSNHSTDPAGAAGNEALHCVNAFDLVRIHKFGELDEGIDREHYTGKNLPSYQAMAELTAEDPNVQRTVAADMFSAQVANMEAEDCTGITPEQFQEENADWQGLLTRNAKSGKLEETLENALTILLHDTKLKNLGGYNEFLDFEEKAGNLPWWTYSQKAPEWTDADTDELILYLEVNYGFKTEKHIKRARDLVHMRNAFHPVREYLDSLEWDGIERLDTLLIDFMGAADTVYTKAVTRKTFVGAVARIYQPGIKMDYVLTLTGAQGLGKSTFIRTLAGDDWFSDSLDTFQGKEAYEALPGNWLIEIGELAAAKRSDQERIKSFLTKTSDQYRKAYAEKKGNYRRQCIFIATTNDNDFLRDQTGGRRWWVVPVSKGRLSVFDDLPEIRDQVWAEAKHRWNQGEVLKLTDEVEAMANAMQNDYTYRSVKYEQIEDFLDTLLPEGWKDMDLPARKVWMETQDPPGIYPRERVCLLEIWQEVFDGNKGNFPNMEQREISQILSNIGWQREPSKKRMGKIYGLQRTFKRPPTVTSDDFDYD